MLKRELAEQIKALDPVSELADEYVMTAYDPMGPLSHLPQNRQHVPHPANLMYVAVWVARGSNEGFYLHVDAVVTGGSHIPLVLAKGWSLEGMLELSQRITTAIYGHEPTIDPWALEEGPE